MSNLGLRVSEACSLEAQNIDFESNKVTVIGKGGLERKIPFKSKCKPFLKGLVSGKEREQYLVQTVPGTVSDNCKKIADSLGVKDWSGTHGFRHSYARNEISERMTQDEKQLFDKCIHNYAKGKLFDYAIQKNSDHCIIR